MKISFFNFFKPALCESVWFLACSCVALVASRKRYKGAHFTHNNDYPMSYCPLRKVFGIDPLKSLVNLIFTTRVTKVKWMQSLLVGIYIY